jgi:hypothetical protein
MRKKLKALINKISKSKISPFFKKVHDLFTVMQYHILCIIWGIQGNHKPTKEEAALVADNVTFIYKSFQRQNMAKRLFYNIQKYYPNAKVIIADDSKAPLKISHKSVEVINLPFNSGLSYGLNRALERVQTPFTMRIDDDMLLTPFTKLHKQLEFLQNNPQVDIVAVQFCNSPFLGNPKDCAKNYVKFSIKNAPKPLIIPHMTRLDKTHYVMGKTPNIFLARTDKYKAIGYDDNIRMIDHHEFFYRAAGNLVVAMDITAFVFHYHNRFDSAYDKYRSDWQNDYRYIKLKHINENY